MSVDLRRKLRIAILLFLPCAAAMGGIAARIPPAATGDQGAPLEISGQPVAQEAAARARGPGDLRRSTASRVRRTLQEATEGVGSAAGWLMSLPRALLRDRGAARTPSAEPPEQSRPAGAISPGSSSDATGARVPPPAARGRSGSEAVEGGGAEVDPAEAAATEHLERKAALKAVVATALKAKHRLKTAEEQRVEELILAAFHEYFRDYDIGGRRIRVRMPFGVNGERQESEGFQQRFYLEGKGTPAELWKRIDALLGSEDFLGYYEALSLPGEKVMILDLERGSYRLSREPELLGSLRAGDYPGTPTRIFVHRFDGPVPEIDIYNYLYAVASVGVDCSGMVQYVHQSVARAYGADLERRLAKTWRIRPSQVRDRVGMWFYDPASGYTLPVEDRIENLRPGDILLFEGSDGSFKHSAVVQAIDFEGGQIRYIQSTDWAAQSERGVHQSLIRFDPAHPEVDLRHYSVRWLQQVRPPFEGELEPRDWLDDGDRYLWYLDAGGSRVVRLEALMEALLEREPDFYTNLFREPQEPDPDSPAL